jgi:hypothetical protein
VSESRIQEAIARIDRAVGRLEAAGRTPDRSSPELANAYAALEERHATLRTRVQDAIERLDGLIAGDGR